MIETKPGIFQWLGQSRFRRTKSCFRSSKWTFLLFYLIFEGRNSKTILQMTYVQRTFFSLNYNLVSPSVDLAAHFSFTHFISLSLRLYCLIVKGNVCFETNKDKIRGSISI